MWFDKKGNQQMLARGKAFAVDPAALGSEQDETWRRNLESADEAVDAARPGLATMVWGAP
jgi:hypothetical protein